MILIVDNYDSFVYNIYQYVAEYNSDILIVRNDKITSSEILKLKPSKIIFSPGPGTPSSAGNSIDIIKKFHMNLPILGICLGHQSIAEAFDIPVKHSSSVRHGKQSRLQILKNNELFKDIPNEFEVTRYHSLSIPKKIGSTFIVI